MPTDQELAKYADVAIKVGLGLTTGDRLVISSPIDARSFTRVLVERAYLSGASNVDVVWSDDFVTKARFEAGSTEAAEAVSGYGHLMNATVENGDYLLYVKADDPDLLADQDPKKLAAYQKVNSEFVKPVRDAAGSLKKNWSIVSAPTPAWAKSVFPEMDADDAMDALWAAILRTCRVDQDDPVAAWEQHIENLAARSAYLNSRHYDSLHYLGPGTDLVVGLPEGHVWLGGRANSANGIGFVPNLPTEEVFTSPDRMRAEGTIAATKPLSLFGTLVEGFRFVMSKGRVVEATAKKGQETLDQLLEVDEGSVRFGETALVPQSSAVASEGLIWHNMLYDENDACHIALGDAFPTAIEQGTELDPDELLARGNNSSSVHVDFVVGSDQLDVFGVFAGGGEEMILAKGEWAFDT